MISETLPELVRGNDLTMFWIVIAILILVKVFVYSKQFFNKC